MSRSRTPGLTFIFITLLIDVIGFGLIIPVLPGLLEQMTGGDLSTASRWGGWLMFTYAAMQFLFSPVMGALSDQFGRRPVILAALFAFSIDFIIQGLAPSIGWYFLGRLLAGITGATFTAAGAYIADVSPPEKRAQNFGIIGAAFGMGFIIGPLGAPSDDDRESTMTSLNVDPRFTPLHGEPRFAMLARQMNFPETRPLESH